MGEKGPKLITSKRIVTKHADHNKNTCEFFTKKEWDDEYIENIEDYMIKQEEVE